MASAYPQREAQNEYGKLEPNFKVKFPTNHERIQDASTFFDFVSLVYLRNFHIAHTASPSSYITNLESL